MRIFRHYKELPEEARGCVVAIGNFDGIHKGHQAVINEAGSLAKKYDKPWAVMTFEPHPRVLFQPDHAPFRLTTMRTKSHLIENMGADVLLVQHFDQDFANLPAEVFVDEVIVKSLGATHVVAGYDFHFGQKRQGNCETLLKFGREKGFAFTAVSQQKDAIGEIFSSTRVREYLKMGNVRAASYLLGHVFELEGRVEHGDARGRQLGFPTANIHLHDYLRPGLGVYAIRAGVDQGPDTKWFDGVANFGRRPTFHAKDDVLLEVHLFDFNEDLYGKHLRVELVERIRDERKFDGLEALKAQIVKDCEIAREILLKAG